MGKRAIVPAMRPKVVQSLPLPIARRREAAAQTLGGDWARCEAGRAGIDRDNEGRKWRRSPEVCCCSGPDRLGGKRRRGGPGRRPEAPRRARSPCCRCVSRAVRPPAKAAVPALIDALKDEDNIIRSRATDALKKIDPESTKKMGVP